MTMYWIYVIPNWLFSILTVSLFVAFGVAGLYVTRGWMTRVHFGEHGHNDIVGFYMAGVTVLYGVSIGLLAIGAWATYTDVQAKVDREAATLAGLYRDTSAYPEPDRSIMQDDLRTYTRQAIDVAWPLQRRGIIPTSEGAALTSFQQHFMAFEPQNERQKILSAETYRTFNELTESRRVRLSTVKQEMPGPLWVLVLAGAFVCLAVSWFYQTNNFRLHFWMTILFSGLLGVLIYLVAVLDNPYRGKVSVSPEPLEWIYEQVMAPPK